MSEHGEKTANAARWTCPGCGRENGPEMVCPDCGFDESANALTYPTLMPLPQGLASPDRARLEAEVRRLQEEKQRHVEEQARLDAEQKNLDAELQRQETAEKQPAEPDDSQDSQGKRIQKKTADGVLRQCRKSLLAVAGAIVVVVALAVWFIGSGGSSTVEDSTTTEDSDATVVYDSTDTEEENVNVTTESGVLGSVGTLYSGASLDGVTAKTDITEVYFLDTLADAPRDAEDLSVAGDGSVLCWTEGTVQYIAGDGGVVGGSNCWAMFMGYENVTAIHFDGNFDTSNITNMLSMFYGCHALTELDVSGFDTSNVKQMHGMFYGCESLVSLDVSGFDTSNVTDMSWMFYDCSSLTSLDVTGFDTSNVTNMYCMFDSCSSLTALDVTGFDTSNVTDMSCMFYACSALTALDVSGWDTSNADTTDMYTGTSWE